ncbi:MAG TPA: hypothetical protein VJ850_05445 [Candidatus Limnocylindrales bacterium]|nr:hypothetical protein [Candidatus Limnocylindrales bacterium]
MIRRITTLLALAAFVAACGNATPTPTLPPVNPTVLLPSDEATPAPSPTEGAALPSESPAGPYDSADYSLTLPDGWVAFDMKDPAGQAALQAFVNANPDFGSSIDAFTKLPNVVMAVNQALGNVVVSVSIPTGGVALDAIAASFTSQFQAVPGVKEAPEPTDLTLAAGPAKHWHIVIEANNASGGTYEVGESIYLTANATTAVLVEFVEVGGTPVSQEDQIIQTLAFK